MIKLSLQLSFLSQGWANVKWLKANPSDHMVGLSCWPYPHPELSLQLSYLGAHNESPH